jgi:type 1 glutamine amidotransferase
MLGINSGVTNPPAAFNQTPDGTIPNTKANSQFTADLATDDLADFTDAKLKNYAMVFSCNPEGTVFSNNTTHDTATGTAAMTALQKYVEGGGAWGGVHSATDFELSGGFPWFTNVLVGAYFMRHDPYPTNDTVVIQGAAASHPVMTGLLTPYSSDEEWYTMNRAIAGRPGFQVLAALTSTNNRPVVWVRELCPNVGTGVCAPSPTNGRSFYTTRGHDASAYKDAEFRKLVLNGILWATHRFKE